MSLQGEIYREFLRDKKRRKYLLSLTEDDDNDEYPGENCETFTECHQLAGTIFAYGWILNQMRAEKQLSKILRRKKKAVKK